MSSSENPFPLEAVVTYPQALVTSDGLSYMTKVMSALSDYLTNYVQDADRYGGALGIVGSHGSGKTHVLTWIGEKVKSLRSTEASTVYAKADNGNFFDCYVQLLGAIGRTRMVELYDRAVRIAAKRNVNAARATASIAKRIDEGAHLEPLYSEGNLDQIKISNDVEHQLYATQVPANIIRTMLSVSNAGYGESAYRWLMGDQIAPPDLAALGLVRFFRQPGETSADSSANVAAIDALEAIAALHRAAEVPLVILIDQLEIFLADGVILSSTTAMAPGSPSEASSRASILKKVVEQMGRQDALVVIAGSDAGWSRLPRDVSARWRERDPIRIGELTGPETDLLLRAYTGEKISMFHRSAIETIHELSGGNPREILRIAFQAFKATSGNLDVIDDTVLLQSAALSGTVEDRSRLALSIADSVLSQFGKVLSDVAVGATKIDRLVMNDRLAVVALEILRATDKLAEVASAQAIASAQAALDGEWPGTALISVVVGYSSTAVQTALSGTVTLIEFEERDFASHLQAAVAQIVAQRPAKVERADADLPNILDRITKQLTELQTHRKEEEVAVQGRLKELSAPTDGDAGQSGKTRWNILSYLDQLDEARKRGDTGSERQFVRAILVANETGRNDRSVDRLGGAYLDILSIATEKSPNGESEDADALGYARADVSRDLNRVVRDASVFRRLVLDWRVLLPWVICWCIVAVICAYVGTIVVLDPIHAAVPKSYSEYLALRAAGILRGETLIVAAFLSLFIGVLIPVTLHRRQIRRDRPAYWERRVEWLRQKFGPADESSSNPVRALSGDVRP